MVLDLASLKPTLFLIDHEFTMLIFVNEDFVFLLDSSLMLLYAW